MLYKLWTHLRVSGDVLSFPLLRPVGVPPLQGRILGVPFTPEQMLARQEDAVAAITEATKRLAAWGARCVGLGAVAAVVGGRGRAVASAVAVPVTTGHALTSYAALRSLELARRLVDLPEDEPVLVLGAPGPVALGLCACLGAQARPTLVAIDPLPPPVARFLRSYPSVEALPREKALLASRLVLGASSTGASVHEQELMPGSVLIDVAQPRDLVRSPARQDLRVVDGELVCLPPGSSLDWLARAYNAVVGQGSRHILACFAEPMVLATLEPAEALDLCGFRRFPLPERILRLGALAEDLGFRVDQLFHRGRALRP